MKLQDAIHDAQTRGISRRKLAAVAAAAPIGIAAGTRTQRAGAQREENELVVGLYAEPPQLNEFYRSDTVGGQINHNIFDKLVSLDFETGEVIPELVESWEMEDDQTWILNLRQGVQWHGDWGEFTADDVVFTISYVLENQTFQSVTAYTAVDSAEAVDQYTVRVNLSQPFGAFLPVVCNYGGFIICKSAHEEIGKEAYGRAPIGTGPFMFDSWDSGSQLVVVKNPNYWQPDFPKLNKITFKFIPDAFVRLQALENGEIDYMDHPNAVDVPQLRDEGIEGITYKSVPGWNWDYMAFSFPPYGEPEKPWHSIKVRQAINFAINRRQLAEEIYLGEATVTDSPIPPGFLGYREGPLMYPAEGDLQKAQELMDEAGVTGFEIEIITSDKEWLRRELELVSAMLSQIGIQVSIQGLDIGTWTDRWHGHKFEGMLEDISIVAPDTDATLYWFHHGPSTNHHGWPRGFEDGGDIAQMLDEARSSNDQDARADIYMNVVDEVLIESPFIYLLHVNIVRLYNASLAGMDPSPQEMLLKLKDVHWT